MTTNNNIKLNKKNHWEKVYTNSDEKELGWYQQNALPSIKLIEKTGIDSNELILDVGSGASILIDELISFDYGNIIATDISEKALNITKNRLDTKQVNNINWIIDDLTKPTELLDVKEVSIWHDRAVLHFLKSKKDQNTYIKLLNSCVKKGKYVIIAAFNFESVDKCSGLPVEKYDERKLHDLLGQNYNLLDCFNHTYTTPYGSTRPYIYTLFQKMK